MADQRPVDSIWGQGGDLGRRLGFAPACFFYADEYTGRMSGIEICEACEDTTGVGMMEGCQKLGGLWRLYPKNNNARTKLLVKGIVLRDCAYSILDRNPFLVNQNNEAPTVKIKIGGCPHSIANSEIEKELKRINGLILVSKIFDQNYRRENGELTNWRSGRRFAFIVKPSSPLPSTFQVGNWSASLYYFGQPKIERRRERETERRQNENVQRENIKDTTEVIEETDVDDREQIEGGERESVSAEIADDGEKEKENDTVRVQDQSGETSENECVKTDVKKVGETDTNNSEVFKSGTKGETRENDRARSRVRSKSESPRRRHSARRGARTPIRREKRQVSDDTIISPSGKVAKVNQDFIYEGKRVDPFDLSAVPPPSPLASLSQNNSSEIE
ncbi:MAG: hypothetical protein GY705_20960 [Bacteroidetes bacterium]|nr:hypothetical protein [Bacteroidota bacterium]